MQDKLWTPPQGPDPLRRVALEMAATVNYGSSASPKKVLADAEKFYLFLKRGED